MCCLHQHKHKRVRLSTSIYVYLPPKLYRDHMVTYGERDVDSFQDGETFTTADGQILTIRRIQKGCNENNVNVL